MPTLTTHRIWTEDGLRRASIATQCERSGDIRAVQIFELSENILEITDGRLEIICSIDFPSAFDCIISAAKRSIFSLDFIMSEIDELGSRAIEDDRIMAA